MLGNRISSGDADRPPHLGNSKRVPHLSISKRVQLLKACLMVPQCRYSFTGPFNQRVMVAMARGENEIKMSKVELVPPRSEQYCIDTIDVWCSATPCPAGPAAKVSGCNRCLIRCKFLMIMCSCTCFLSVSDKQCSNALESVCQQERQEIALRRSYITYRMCSNHQEIGTRHLQSLAPSFRYFAHQFIYIFGGFIAKFIGFRYFKSLWTLPVCPPSSAIFLYLDLSKISSLRPYIRVPCASFALGRGAVLMGLPH
ncbi:hypothetical protein Mapa_017340 [Marchantia paleacea]|nr:hypothetical protein Mapa_017340 [Marchantia paleacea]